LETVQVSELPLEKAAPTPMFPTEAIATRATLRSDP
jgi:hypothetical protein